MAFICFVSIVLSVKMTNTPTPHWCAIASLGVRCVNEVNGNEFIGCWVAAAFLGKLAFCEQNDDLTLRKCARRVINKRGTLRSPQWLACGQIALVRELIDLVVDFCQFREAEIVSCVEQTRIILVNEIVQ